jgi:predicted dehydrogenase
MLRAAVIGAGRMGRGHIGVYQQLEREGFGVKLVAICDVDEPKLHGEKAYALNIGKSAGVAHNKHNYSTMYNCYTDAEEMLRKEQLDVVNVVVPTYLHAEISQKALRAGVNVLCEKPMALTPEQCEEMIACAEQTGKRLMIGQCLHFWKEYEILAEKVKSGEYGKVNDAYFYRGGAQNVVTNPSWQQWILDRKLGGGGLFDQHIHDIDVIRWCFGTPKAVSTVGKTVYPKSAYDICTTRYFFDDADLYIHARDNTCYKGSYGFQYGYTVNFEHCTMVFEHGQLTIMEEGKEPVLVEKPQESEYYYEIKYFLENVVSGEPFSRNEPRDAQENVRIALAEMASADRGGETVTL